MIEKVMKIYILIDPRDNAIRYVGATGVSLKQRLKAHISKRLDGTARGDWINELYQLDIRPIITAVEEVGVERASDAERRCIQSHKDGGCLLLNSENGLPGFVGGTLSEEHKLRISERRTGTKMQWRDPDARSRKLSDALRGKPKSREHMMKISQQKRGKSRLPTDVQTIIPIMFQSGMSLTGIAREIGCSRTSVNFIIKGPNVHLYKL